MSSNPSLYKVVVSEFMLQQTRVTTVLPYFKKWVTIFSSFQKLSEASEEEVLKHWEGLGYYERARNLHKLAKVIMQLKIIPKTPEEWQKFPGIGLYTSNAISSIIFNIPVAAIDGNVIRVLTRLTLNRNLFKNNNEASYFLKPLANYLLDKDNPGDHNQAMMELGSTICTKYDPSCLLCPVRQFCSAVCLKDFSMYPNIKKTETKKKTVKRAWITSKNKILLIKNTHQARRLKNIFELPEINETGITLTEGKPLLIKKRMIGNELIKELIFKINITKHIILFAKEKSNMHWIDLKMIDNIILSGPHKKWITQVLKSI